jgi:hypothetical protein
MYGVCYQASAQSAIFGVRLLADTATVDLDVWGFFSGGNTVFTPYRYGWQRYNRVRFTGGFVQNLVAIPQGTLAQIALNGVSGPNWQASANFTPCGSVDLAPVVEQITERPYGATMTPVNAFARPAEWNGLFVIPPVGG